MTKNHSASCILLRGLLGSLLLICINGPAQAILFRSGLTYSVPGFADYNRYISLANQTRFDTVGEFHSPTTDCTGTLISANIVLTAAHCFATPLGLGPITVVPGFQQNASLSAMPILPGTSVIFEEGSNLHINNDPTNGPLYPTAASSYVMNVDAVSIYPTYSVLPGLRNLNDLALARVSPIAGTVPNNYLPLNTNINEAAGTTFAELVGYGSTGNGISGEQPNAADEKRAGLTQVKSSLIPNTLSATFYNPASFPAGYPPNFLQAGLAEGDSGGPLIANLGSGDAIIGVAEGISSLLGNGYGATDTWTRVSSFTGWITNESALLGSLPVQTVAGTVISDPIMASSVVTNASTIVKEFSFFATAYVPVYLDPPSSGQIDVNVESGPDIAAIFLPSGFGAFADLWEMDSGTGKFVDTGLDVMPDTWFDFSSPVRSFELRGLDNDLSGLALGFEFDGAGNVALSWTDSLSTDATPPGPTGVPEPATLFVFVAGLFGAGAARRLTALKQP